MHIVHVGDPIQYCSGLKGLLISRKYKLETKITSCKLEIDNKLSWKN